MPRGQNCRIGSALLILMIATGCVERRFVIETNVPGAQVAVNNVPVGPGPADARWEYPGRYEFRAVAQGYQPARQIEHVKARWWDYPPFDFVLETLWPFHIEDVRRFRLDLVPATQVRSDELLDQANDLRNQASQLPPSTVPDR
jgi:hypothetical protein